MHRFEGQFLISFLNRIRWGRLLLLLLPILYSTCTAYFNTYYNAETAFKEGQKEHLKLLQNNPDSIIVTPSADIIAKYDRTIEKTIKVIETFKKRKKWHDDALFLMGKAHFYKMEMTKAIRRLRQLELEFPQSEHIPQAYLYMGKAYIEDGNLDKAEEILTTAEKKYPQLNKEHQITLLLIAIAIRRDGKSQAISLLEQTRKSIRSEALRNDLLLRTAELYIDLKQYDKAIMLIKSVPRKRKDNFLLRYRMDRVLLNCYKAIDSLQTALNLIDRMIDEKNYNMHIDEMLYQKGIILSAMGYTDEAIKVFKKLTAGLDSASILTDTSTYKARALMELALIYQKNKEDYKKAETYYTLAAAAKDSGSKVLAKQRLSAMERLVKLREASDKEDSITGYRTFKIGELFNFELDEPDSAYDNFIQIIRDTAADTGIVPKALCQAARIARDALHDTVKSDSIFRSIIAMYPATEYAKTSQSELNLEVTIKTRQDSADEMFRKAEQLYYRDNNVKEAIRRFFELSKRYPDLPIAPKSLFAAAWFSDNILFKNRTAKMLYEKLCDNYAESDYCVNQAKPRIKIVVDTLAKLEQLRKSNEKEQKKHRKRRKKSVQSSSSVADSTEMLENQQNNTSEPLSEEEIHDTSSAVSSPTPNETPVDTSPPESKGTVENDVKYTPPPSTIPQEVKP